MSRFLKAIFTVAFIASCFFVNAQSQQPDPYSPVELKIDLLDTTNNCRAIDSMYAQDKNNHIIRLFLQGGIAPVVYTNDKEFEKKYDVFFYDFGCVAPYDNCVIRYNRNAFDYLTRTYGKKWMKEMRKDVIGFKQWKSRKLWKQLH